MVIRHAVAGLAAIGVLVFATAGQAGVPTTTTITVSPNPASAGQTVTLGATVNSPGFSCTGAVDFRDTVANATVCSSPLTVLDPNTSTASCTTTRPAGSYTLRADTLGMCTSFSAPATLVVNAAPAAVPTVGEWTMWGLTGLLLIGGGVVASRRFRATAA